MELFLALSFIFFAALTKKFKKMDNRSKSIPSKSASATYPINEFIQHPLIYAKQPSFGHYLLHCKEREENILFDAWLLEHHQLAPSKSSTAVENACKTVLENYIGQLPNISLDTRKEITELSALAPITSSTNIKPDITIYYQDTPICFVEVHSYSSSDHHEGYLQTLVKNSINTIDLMRLIMSQCKPENGTDFAMNSLVFPKTSDKKDKSYGFFTKLTVTFTIKPNLGFKVALEYIPSSNIKQIVTEITKQNIKKLADVDLGVGGSSYFLKLPKEFLRAHKVSQIYSKYSIVISSTEFDYVYKFSCNDAITRQLIALYFLPKKPLLAAFPIGVEIFGGLTFFKFQKYSAPVTADKALKNVANIIFGVISALDELHNSFHIAHLDVRLDNICFDKFGNPILVDFDRSMPSEDSFSASLMYSQSCMYECPEQLIKKSVITNSEMDYVQLGYMILWIVWCHKDKSFYDDTGSTLYHSMKSADLNKLRFEDSDFYAFLASLIRKGIADFKC